MAMLPSQSEICFSVDIFPFDVFVQVLTIGRLVFVASDWSALEDTESCSLKLLGSSVV